MAAHFAYIAAGVMPSSPTSSSAHQNPHRVNVIGFVPPPITRSNNTANNNDDDTNNRTLFDDCKAGYLDGVIYKINNVSDIDINMIYNDNNETPLWISCSKGHFSKPNHQWLEFHSN